MDYDSTEPSEEGRIKIEYCVSCKDVVFNLKSIYFDFVDDRLCIHECFETIPEILFNKEEVAI